MYTHILYTYIHIYYNGLISARYNSLIVTFFASSRMLKYSSALLRFKWCFLQVELWLCLTSAAFTMNMTMVSLTHGFVHGKYESWFKWDTMKLMDFQEIVLVRITDQWHIGDQWTALRTQYCWYAEALADFVGMLSWSVGTFKKEHHYKKYAL